MWTGRSGVANLSPLACDALLLSFQVILTKCDHLSAEEVAKSTMIVYNHLLALKKKLDPTFSTSTRAPAATKKKRSDKGKKVEEEDEESEYEGTIGLKDLMKNGYRLPSEDESSTLGKHFEKKIVQERSNEQQSEETIDENGVVYSGLAQSAGGEVYEDEDSFTEKVQFERRDSHQSSSQSESRGQSSGDLVITEEGEILGGNDVDFSNLSSRNYTILMRSAKRQLQLIKETRDRELAENGSVDYEIIDIEDEELEYESEQEEDDEEEGDGTGQGPEEEGYNDSSLAEVMRYVVPISATSGAGINQMWEDIRQCVISTVAHPVGWEDRDKEGEGIMSPERRAELGRMVREHKLANQERKRISNGKQGSRQSSGGRGEGRTAGGK